MRNFQDEVNFIRSVADESPRDSFHDIDTRIQALEAGSLRIRAEATG